MGARYFVEYSAACNCGRIRIYKFHCFDENAWPRTVPKFVLVGLSGKGEELIAYLNRHRTSSFAQRIVSCLSTASLTCLFLLSSNFIHAAPITLQFDAVIGAPRADTFPIELPFSLSEGQRISGAFTFEPFDAPSSTLQINTTQNFSLRLEIETVELITSTYQLQADNNLTSDEAPIRKAD